jgi:transcriptional regulator with XRE-family HTH domain
MKMNNTHDITTASNEASEAVRIGNRIQQIRESKGISRAELGARIGLDSGRIHKYEHGIRKPKTELLQLIADTLEVDILSLLDPVISSKWGFMYALFEMEQEYGLKVNEIDGKIVLSFGSSLSEESMEMLKFWRNKNQQYIESLQNAINEEEQESVRNEYNDWKWNFPKKMRDALHSEAIKRRRDAILLELSRLQTELANLEET